MADDLEDTPQESGTGLDIFKTLVTGGLGVYEQAQKSKQTAAQRDATVAVANLTAQKAATDAQTATALASTKMSTTLKVAMIAGGVLIVGLILWLVLRKK